MSRSRRKINIPVKSRCAIVVEGETELWYVNMIKRNNRNLGLAISPSMIVKKSIDEQIKHIKKLAEIYDQVFWIVDLDVIMNESLLQARHDNKPITKLRAFTQHCEDELDNVQIIINHPCIEYWFLVHYQNTSPHFTNCDEAGIRLKRHLPEYEKTEKFFTNPRNDIYMRMLDTLPNAISYSESLGEFDIDNPRRGLTQMHRLINGLKLLD